MAFTTVCPNCDARLTAPDTVLGKKVKCKKCDEPFVAKRTAAGADDEDERPAKPAARSRRDDDEDTPSKKATKARRPAGDDDEDADEEPPPKAKKKGKKKKKQGSPALLFVLLGVGAVVLIGGGLAVYFGFIKEDKPTESVDQGDGPKGAGGKGAAGGGTAGWVEIHEPAGKYRVKFPTQPNIRPVQMDGAFGQVEVKTYRTGGKDEGFFGAHIPIGADRMGMSDEQVLSAVSDMLRTLFKGATVTSTTAVMYQGFSGREEVMTPPERKGVLIMRLVLAGDRVILVMGGGDSAAAAEPRVKAFFETLKIE